VTTRPSPSDPAAVALELERIRRITRTDGALALLVQRHGRTDEAIKEHGRRIDGHDGRLDTVERGETERQKRNDERLDARDGGHPPEATQSVRSEARP
jgi:hypothetical protein